MSPPAASGQCGTSRGLSGAWSLSGFLAGGRVRAGAERRRVAWGALPGSGGLRGVDHLGGYLVVGLGGLQPRLAGGQDWPAQPAHV
jgi:hypothetical protein